jgi:hypothetical protein
MRTNPGGLAVVWAEENSRDALFDALRRRETYATSGTRPVVRFFGGDLAGVACGTSGFVHDAYASGTPMGGELGPVRGSRSPRFAVWAMKDPGSSALPGTDLQRVQIVKGWVDARGRTHERVFDVAGDRERGSVDAATCAPRGEGFRELCAVWRDPTFRKSQRAFYYARVLENPTCRWSTLVCRSVGVDPLSPACTSQAAAAGPAFGDCCLGPGNDAFMEPVVQERAWTSPIWYRPEGIAGLRARIRFGEGTAADRLDLRVALGRLPRGLDPGRQPLEIRLTDDDDIFRLTVPARRFRRRGAGHWTFMARSPAGGVVRASLVARARGEAVLRLRAGPLDLSRADRVEHMVSLALTLGVHRFSHARLWLVRDGELVPGGS